MDKACPPAMVRLQIIAAAIPLNLLPAAMAGLRQTATLEQVRAAGAALLAGGHLDEAARLYNALADVAGQHAWVHAGRAQTAMRQGAWETAAAAWRFCLTRFSEAAAPHWLTELACAEQRLGHDEEAILDSMAARFPDTNAARTRLATVAARRQDWPEALRQWTLCLEADPAAGRPEWWNGRAQALLRLGRPEEAIAAWTEIIKRFPDFPRARLQMAAAARELGNWPLMRQCYAGQIARFADRIAPEWLADERLCRRLGR